MEEMLGRLRAASSPASALTRFGDDVKHAAVLCLMYPSPSAPHDDLNVILTLRAAKMRSHAGDVSFPGGRQDPGEEGDPWTTALREADEEIGLPRDTRGISRISTLPPYLAKNHLLVTPCIAFLPSDPYEKWTPSPNEAEVDAVFTIKLSQIVNGEAYLGRWMQWYELAWKLHRFELASTSDAPAPTLSSDLRNNRRDNATLQRRRSRSPSPASETDLTFTIWGLTARILVDIARIAFGRAPSYEFVDEVGDSSRILKAQEQGVMGKQTAEASTRAEQTGEGQLVGDTARPTVSRRGAL
ncbi:8-oxo-dGTP diphosphatase [Savitreella phatthalungensis]